MAGGCWVADENRCEQSWAVGCREQGLRVWAFRFEGWFYWLGSEIHVCWCGFRCDKGFGGATIRLGRWGVATANWWGFGHERLVVAAPALVFSLLFVVDFSRILFTPFDCNSLSDKYSLPLLLL